MRSSWLRVGPDPVTGVLRRREKFGHRHRRHREECGTDGAETGGMRPQAKDTGSCQKLEGAVRILP